VCVCVWRHLGTVSVYCGAAACVTADDVSGMNDGRHDNDDECQPPDQPHIDELISTSATEHQQQPLRDSSAHDDDGW